MGVNPSCCGPNELPSIEAQNRRQTQDEKPLHDVMQTPSGIRTHYYRTTVNSLDRRPKEMEQIGQLELGHSRNGLLTEVFSQPWCPRWQAQDDPGSPSVCCSGPEDIDSRSDELHMIRGRAGDKDGELTEL